MKTLHTLFLAALLFLSASAARAVNVSEGADFPNITPAAPYLLQFGTNTFSGSVSTPSDGQDRFDVTVPPGMRIVSATKTFAAGGGVSGANISFATEDLSGTGAGTFVNNYPLGPGTYSCIVNANFSVGNAWSVTLTVDSLVTWTTSTVTGPADVLSSGTLIGALDVGGSVAQTVNGVTFAADPGGTGAIAMGSATATFNFSNLHPDFMVETSIDGSTQYAAALDSGRWVSTPTSGTVTLGGLVVGRTYQVQLWITDSRGCCNTRTRTVDGVATNSAGPQIATGTFTAAGTTQAITIAGADGPQLNLLQLREPVVLVQPAAITSSTSATDFYPASQLIDGSGLSATPTVANLGTHAEAGSGTTAWVTRDNSPDYYTAHPAPVLTCTLPGGRNITELVIWPYNFFAGTTNGNEAKTFDVAFSTDGTTFTNTVTVTSPTPLVSNGLRLPLGTPRFATHVRVTITDNHYLAAAGGDRVGLGEIRFVATPEIYVTNTADSGPGSLRQALADAAATPGSNTILFTSGLNGQSIALNGIADATNGASALTVSDADGVTLDATNLSGGITLTRPAGAAGDGYRAIRVAAGSSLTLRRITLAGFAAQGGSHGGAVMNAGTLTLERCTLSGNSAFGGGALYDTGATASAALLQCTLSGNTAGFGGGIWTQDAALTLTHCTVSSNTGTGGTGGIVLGNGTATLRHTIVAANSATGTNDVDLGGGGTAVTAAGANLIGINDGSYAGTFPTGPLVGTSAAPVNPLLGALASNSGPTKTMLPGHGSPAINAATGSTITSDQRGFAVVGTPDIGASENRRPSFSTLPAAQTVGEGTPNLVVPFTVADDESTPAQLTMVDLKKSTVVVPGATFGGSGANRTVTIPGPIPLADNGASFSITISDGTATRSASFLLTVTADTIPPVISNVPANVTVAATSPAGAVVTYSAATATDNVAVTSLTYSHASGSTFPLGTTTVTITAADFAGNNATATFTVTVLSLSVTATGDSGSGTLRDALANAATLPGANTITFPTNFTGPVALTGPITVADPDVTIDAGNVPGGVTISGGNTTRLFTVNAGAGMTLKNLTLTGGNGSGSAGGAINSSGTLTVTDCTFTGNQSGTANGGAILNNSTLVATRCTFTGNSAATNGGAVSCGSGSTNSVTNCTFTGNSITGGTQGGGAINFSAGATSLTLTHCTIAGNSSAGTEGGGGIRIRAAGLTLQNCIVAGNTITAGTGADIFNSAAFTATGGNIVQSRAGAGTVTGTLTNADPLLAPLASNGGITQTRALLPGSPALDAGTATATATDQRGFSRNRDGNATIGALPDAGAYEAQLAPFSIGFNMGDAAVNGGDVLGSTEIAGVFPQANWNHLAGNANSGGLTADTATRLDSSGATLPGLKLWWNGPNTWRIGDLADTADKKLMFGYLDSNGSGDGSAATDLFNNASAQPYVAIAGLPAILGGYRVLVYADGDATDNRVGSYWLASNTGQNPANVSAEAPLTPRVFLRDAANFATTYTRATGTSDTGATTSAGNYVQFDNLTETAFTVRAEEHAFRAPINAVQIVRNEIVVVTTAADENDPIGTLGTGISLREAIRDAASGSGIVFDPAIFNGEPADTITFLAANSGFVLDKDLTIDAGNIAGGVTINAAASSGNQKRIFTLSAGRTAALLGLNLTGAYNTTLDSGYGGAIHSQGRMSLTACHLTANVASEGGAAYCHAATQPAYTILRRCTVSGNQGLAHAGAIEVWADGHMAELHLEDSTLSGNTTPGYGGAVWTYADAARGIVTARRTTVTANQGDLGGAFDNQSVTTGSAELTLSHCTVAGNIATTAGGGIVSGNTGSPTATATCTLAHTIIAGNSAPSAAFGPDLIKDGANASFTSLGGNLIGKTDGSGATWLGSDLTGTAASPLAPLLAPLNSYGGPTQTMPPRTGSPAINAATGSTATADQRGLPIVGTPDIGAAERQPAAVVTTTADTGAGSLRQTLADALADTVTFAPTLTGPIVLTNEIIVGSSVTIDASGIAGGVTIDGGAGTNRILSINTGQAVRLKNLTFTGGGGTGTTGNGFGGAIYNRGALTVERCTFTVNNTTGAGTDGGAIFNAGNSSLDVSHSTFAANTAVDRGGAINNDALAIMNITHCTIAGNSASAETAVRNSGTFTLANSIVVGGTYNTSLGSILRMGANIATSLSSDITGPGISGPSHSTANPLLAPLGNYGGPTQTMALLPGSLARNAATGSAATSDQRGFAMVGAAWDIGAYEAGNHLGTIYNAWIYETLPATATVPQHATTFDFDGDGQNNNAEWLALTNAANPNSRFTLTISPISGGNLPFSFQSALGRNYIVEFSTDLTAPWQTSPDTIVGTGGVINATIGPVTGFTKYFIRIKASLPP